MYTERFEYLISFSDKHFTSPLRHLHKKRQQQKTAILYRETNKWEQNVVFALKIKPLHF